MSGYQESVTDPSFAGQIITFTYPHVGNYGVSAEAMESDRIHARGVIMREAGNGEDAPGAEGGWLDWLRDCGVPGITGVDTRALVRHLRDAGAMRGGIFAGISEAEARDLVAAEPEMNGQDLARTVTPGEHAVPRRPRPADRADRHRRQGLDRAPAAAARRGDRAASLHRHARGAARRRRRRGLPRQRPRRPRRPGLRRRDRPRRDRQGAGVGDLPRPPAALPRRRPGDLQAPVRPPRRQPPGQGPRLGPHRDHEPEPRLRGARARAAATRSTRTRPCAGTPTTASPS